MGRWTFLLLLLLVGCAEATVTHPTVPVVSVPMSEPTPPPAPPAPPEPAPVSTPAAAPPSDECIRASPKGNTTSPRKRQLVEDLLQGQSVFLLVDARRAGVLVPAYLAKEPMLWLEVGYAMPTPIPDLNVDDKGVSGTLSFQRTPFFTQVPWAALYVATGAKDRLGWQWDEDVPADQRCK